jgi:hypothetical protein
VRRVQAPIRVPMRGFLFVIQNLALSNTETEANCSQFDATTANRSVRIESSDLCLEIRFGLFENLRPSESGGAVFANVTSTVTIEGCRFVGCWATSQGGGCWLRAPSGIAISSSVADVCYAWDGQFVFCSGGGDGITSCNTTDVRRCAQVHARG